MISLDWLSDRLCEALRWQLANPGRTDGPEVPWAGRRIWSIFIDLNAARGSNGWGPNSISYQEIEAWAWLRREPVRPWECDVIRALDREWLKGVAAKADGDKPVEASSRPMSPALFDAIFAG